MALNKASRARVSRSRPARLSGDAWGVCRVTLDANVGTRHAPGRGERTLRRPLAAAAGCWRRAAAVSGGQTRARYNRSRLSSPHRAVQAVRVQPLCVGGGQARAEKGRRAVEVWIHMRLKSACPTMPESRSATSEIRLWALRSWSTRSASSTLPKAVSWMRRTACRSASSAMFSIRTRTDPSADVEIEDMIGELHLIAS
jgi:hypothetical protein